MPDFDGTAYILFLKEIESAWVVFNGEVTEPLYTRDEILFTLRALQRHNFIDESTSQFLQADAHRVPIKEVGIRREFFTTGVYFGRLKIILASASPVSKSEVTLPKPPQDM